MVWDESKFLKDELTKLSEAEAASSLYEAWYIVYGESPSIKTLAILLAQTALETGRWKLMHNGNWGNIKSRPTDNQYWTMFECGEVIKGVHLIFKPPHDQCKFRAYLSPTDGAIDYLKFLQKKRYEKALLELKKGNVVQYTTQLKIGGYFTASLDRYLKTMNRLFQEFLGKLPKYLSDIKKKEKIEIPSIKSYTPIKYPMMTKSFGKLNKITPNKLYITLVAIITAIISLYYSL